jgi:hypothetical protein
LGNGEFKWMEENWRGFWEILTYSGNFSTPMPFIPVHSTDSQTSPKQVSSKRDDIHLGSLEKPGTVRPHMISVCRWHGGGHHESRNLQKNHYY